VAHILKQLLSSSSPKIKKKKRLSPQVWKKKPFFILMTKGSSGDPALLLRDIIMKYLASQLYPGDACFPPIPHPLTEHVVSVPANETAQVGGNNFSQLKYKL
jgi:hypothetical protein